jgi:hypothetical protein
MYVVYLNPTVSRQDTVEIELFDYDSHVSALSSSKCHMTGSDRPCCCVGETIGCQCQPRWLADRARAVGYEFERKRHRRKRDVGGNKDVGLNTDWPRLFKITIERLRSYSICLICEK